MENQIKDAKRQLLKGELAGYEFNDRMKNKVLEELPSTRKVSKIKQNTKRVIPVVLSVSLIALFFAGIYTFVLNSDLGGTNANHSKRKITVDEDNDQKPRKKDEETTIPQVENESSTQEKEIIDSDSNIEQPEAPNVVKETVYFDEEFASLAKQGFIKGLPFQVGTTVGEIKEQYGEPQQYGAEEGAFSLEYESLSFYYPGHSIYEERANVKDDVSTVGALFQMKEKLYLSDMKKGLGEPDVVGVSEMNGLFTIKYEFGNYKLFAVTESDEESPLRYVELIKKINGE